MKENLSKSPKIIHSEVQEVTLHFQNSPFLPTNLTIKFNERLLALKTKGVSTIRKSVILDGIVSSIQDVKTMVEQTYEIKSEHTKDDYLLHFFDCQKNKLGYIRAKIKENTPIQEIDSHF